MEYTWDHYQRLGRNFPIAVEKPTVTLRNGDGAQVGGAMVEVLTEKGTILAEELFGPGLYSFDLPEGTIPFSLKVKITHPEYLPITRLLVWRGNENHLVFLARSGEFYYSLVNLLPLKEVEECIEFNWNQMQEIVPNAAQQAEIDRVNALQAQYGKKGALPQFGSRVKNKKVNPNPFLGDGWDTPPYIWLPDDAIQRKALLAKMNGFKHIHPIAVHYLWDNNNTASANATPYSFGFHFPAHVQEAEIRTILEPLGFRVKNIHPPMIGFEYYHIAYADYAGIPSKEMIEKAAELMNQGVIYTFVFNSAALVTTTD